jgi:WD40 repeat protein
VALWTLEGIRLATFEGHTDKINQLESSSDGLSILTAAEDATARLWDIEGRLVKTFGLEDKVDYTSATFSVAGDYAIVSSKDHSIDFWYIK